MTAQVPEPDPAGSRTVPGPGEWLSVAEAARRLGVTEKAVRNRIRRGTLEWRSAGNHGREVLLSPDMEAGDAAGDAAGDDPGTVELQVRAARLEERLAVVERERDLYRDLFRDREAALAEARRPWLAKVLEGLRRKGS
jgi:hypothetical protein